MNLLHDIPAGDPNKLVNVVVEIPIGSRIKYEYNKELETIAADRFLYTAFTYPFNYGFVPQTWSEDEDALDMVVIASEPVATGVVIECRVIGGLQTEDEEGNDAKLIAVPKGKIDPMFAKVDTLNDVPEAWKNKIKHFYENYKSIEPGKWVKVTDWMSKEDAVKTVEECVVRYKKEVNH